MTNPTDKRGGGGERGAGKTGRFDTQTAQQL